MKKSLLIAALVLLTTAALAQDINGYDGDDWRTWDRQFKEHFVHGFIAGNIATFEMITNKGPREGALWIAQNALLLEIKVRELVDAVDRFYATNPRRIYVWIAIFDITMGRSI